MSFHVKKRPDISNKGGKEKGIKKEGKNAMGEKIGRKERKKKEKGEINNTKERKGEERVGGGGRR